MHPLINKIHKKLKGELPGETAQYLMAPEKRGRIRDYGDETLFKPSAVLILLCADEHNEFYFPLTQRFAYDGIHSGQVSLPGGKADSNDKDLTATALRECEEEIGVKDNIEVLGNLSALYIPVSNFLVQPVVAYCSGENVLMLPHVKEVKHIVKFYLKDLLNESIVKEDDINLYGGGKIKAPCFETEGLKVWGATAMILSEFKVILKTIF